MSAFVWAWGTSFKEPAIASSELPPECLVFETLLNGNNYWAAYRKGRQVAGATYPCGWTIDRGEGLHMVHTLQWVKGYGPVYWCQGPGEYYRVNLFLIGYDDLPQGQGRPTESYDFDPTNL